MHHMTWAVNFAKAYQEAAPTSQWKYPTMFKYIIIKNKDSTSIADNLLACIKSQYKQSSHYNELLLYFHCKTTLVWNKYYKTECCNISEERSISNVICNQTPTCKPLYLTAITQSLILNLQFTDYKVNIKFTDWKFVIDQSFIQVILPNILWQTQQIKLSAPKDIWHMGVVQSRSLAPPPLNLIS